MIFRSNTCSTRTKRSKNLPQALLLGFATLLSVGSHANNIVVSNPTVVGANLQFNISWDNSWSTTLGPANWDAVWIFVKRQSCTDNLWVHAPLNTNSGAHSTAGLLQVNAVSDGLGVFVRRSAAGFGNIPVTSVTIALQTPANGTDNFQVLGLEMVSVPEGDFYIGDGAGQYSFSSVLITSAIQSAGLGTQSNYTSWGSTAPLPNTYPHGWNNFYIMKYEVSQDSYASYLNCLTYNQQFSRTSIPPQNFVGTLMVNQPSASRNGIRIKVPGVPSIMPAVYGCDLNNNGVFAEADDGANIACNWLSWPDLMSYLDWSGLRPMSEFEYEKACRGVVPGSNPNEYAWSNSMLLQAESGALSNAATGTELSTSAGNGLCAYGAGSNGKGPLRCGFAASSGTTRFQSGGSFYGVMELSGNVNEQCVGGYAFNYSAFTRVNGNGAITANGSADTVGWPTLGGGQFGGLSRGGDWFNVSSFLRVSDRAWIINNTNQGRLRTHGGRGVRNY